MRRALLDVNVFLALMDAEHAAHESAHAWFDTAKPGGWATCAITQNGFVRILSQPKYPGAVPVAQALSMVRRATGTESHEFWACDIGLTEVVATDRLLGHRQITDAYLLALAVRHGGRFVTLDRTIPLEVVPGAQRDQLVVL